MHSIQQNFKLPPKKEKGRELYCFHSVLPYTYTEHKTNIGICFRALNTNFISGNI